MHIAYHVSLFSGQELKRLQMWILRKKNVVSMLSRCALLSKNDVVIVHRFLVEYLHRR